MTTMHDRILALLASRPGEWVNAWELRSVNSPEGWIGTSGDRRARELAERGQVLRRLGPDGFVQYRDLTSVCTACRTDQREFGPHCGTCAQRFADEQQAYDQGRLL